MKFDIRRGSHSVGTHVRDAACYVCWAFARAYSSQDMAPFVSTLSTALIAASVFDREINIRRASSAAFQENVGRLQDIYDHGIYIVQCADYFAVGNRARAFTKVALEIARLDQVYARALVNHLLQVSCCHWDVNIRELAAESIYLLASDSASSYILELAFPVLVRLVS